MGINTGNDVQPESLSWLGWLDGQKAVNAITILAFLGSVLVFANNAYKQAYTHPIGGYEDTSVPAMQGGTSVHTRKWTVFNPGPGKLSNVKFEFYLDDQYDAGKDEFVSGMLLGLGPGVEKKIEKNGARVRVQCIPNSSSIDCYQKMECWLHWSGKPGSCKDVHVMAGGTAYNNIDQPFKGEIRNTGGILLPVISAVGSLVLLVFLRLQKTQIRMEIEQKVIAKASNLRKEMKFELKQEKLNLEASIQNRYMKTLRAAGFDPETQLKIFDILIDENGSKNKSEPEQDQPVPKNISQSGASAGEVKSSDSERPQE